MVMVSCKQIFSTRRRMFGFVFIIEIFVGYVSASLFFLKYPQILHKTRNPPYICRHISHRGGCGENYENTMAAFHHAVKLGTDMLELDCRLTKDKKVVVLHDKNLLRITGRDLDVSEVNYADLPPLQTVIPFTSDLEAPFYGSGDCSERIALLEEVFEAFRHIPINIDIKEDDDELISQIMSLISKYKREDFTVCGSFQDNVCRKVYDKNPNIKLLFSVKRVAYLLIFYYTGLLPFIPIKETHLEIFLPSFYFKRFKDVRPSWKPFYNILEAIIHFLLIRKGLFEYLQKRGIQTYMWVLNDEDEYKVAFEAGATGVMTDFPTRLKIFLTENPQYCVTF